jgi:putative iron-only hydrogenase system regulator
MEAQAPRLSLVGVVFQDATDVRGSIEGVLGMFSDLVLARMIVPQCSPECSLLAIVLSATTDQVGALAGRLGMLADVRVKSVIL